MFSLFSGEAETDRQLELYAKGLEDLMNKYENKAAADAELSQKKHRLVEPPYKRPRIL